MINVTYQISDEMTPLDVQDDTIIIRQGDGAGTLFYILEEGRANLLIIDNSILFKFIMHTSI